MTKQRRGLTITERPGHQPVADLEALPQPVARYDLALLVPAEVRANGATRKGFESEADASREDRHRVRLLLDPPADLPKRQRRAAKRLGRRLRRALRRGTLLPSAASARFMREHRRRYGGLLLQALEAQPEAEIVHIIQGDEVTADGLPVFDITKLKARLRGQIQRQLCGRQGFILLFFHGEWDKNRQVFSLHWHGFASGAYLQALRQLRVKAGAKGEARNVAVRRSGAKHPIQIKPIQGPRQVSYQFQSWWPAKRIRYSRSGGRMPSKRLRVPAEAEVQWLLWADGQTWGDRRFCMGRFGDHTV